MERATSMHSSFSLLTLGTILKKIFSIIEEPYKSKENLDFKTLDFKMVFLIF